MDICIKEVRLNCGALPRTGQTNRFFKKLSGIDKYPNSAGEIVSFDQINSFYFVSRKVSREKQIVVIDNLGKRVALKLGEGNELVHDYRGLFTGQITVEAQFDRYDVVIEHDETATETINGVTLMFLNERKLSLFQERIPERTRSLIKGLTKISPLITSDLTYVSDHLYSIRVFISDADPGIIVDDKNHITYIADMDEFRADDTFLWEDEYGISVRRDAYADNSSRHFINLPFLVMRYVNMNHDVDALSIPIGKDISIVVDKKYDGFNAQIFTDRYFVDAAEALIKYADMETNKRGTFSYDSNYREFYLKIRRGLTDVLYVSRRLCDRWICFPTTADSTGRDVLDFTVVSKIDGRRVDHNDVEIDIGSVGDFTIPASGFFTELRKALECHDCITIRDDDGVWRSVNVDKLSMEVYKDHTMPYSIKAVVNDDYNTIYYIEPYGLRYGLVPLVKLENLDPGRKFSSMNCVAAAVRKIIPAEEGNNAMIDSCFKLIEGKLKTTNQAYGVIKLLGETRRVHSSADGMNDILRIPTGTKFHVVVRGDSKAMLVFMEGKFGGNVTYRQLLIDANKHVITVGNILQSLDLVRRNVAVLEWICDEPVKEVAEPAAPAPTKSNISVTTEHGYHPMSQMIYTDKLVIGNVNYRIGFANNGMEVRIGNVDDGRWLLAVINYLGRLSNLKDASVIVVSRILYEDNSVGAMMMGVPGQRPTANNYYVMSSVDGELRSCGIPDKYFPTGMEMHVIIEGPVEEKASMQKKEQSEWIPHSGQFVVIKDDPKKTMYILSDYDQAAHKFVLTLADSARRERLETLQIRGEQATVMVEPSKIRPFVLTY